ncbi:MAG: hypothetical protein EOM87_03170 [Clostridia bacterium]|nr:hypothetical protein [Clostridia bacterium]
MKKIIMAVLLIIPVIVILVINVSGLIISSAVALDVENIILTHEGIALTSCELNLEDYANKTYNIGVEYYPRIALNTAMLWTSSDTEIAEVHEGKVTLKNYGSVDITAMSVSNNNAKASCTLYIGGQTLRNIRILTYGRFDEGNLSIKKYEQLQLEGAITPSGALGNNKVIWSSNNSNIVSVDANGVITAKTAGTATITASAANTLGTVTKSITVTVAGEALIKQSSVYTQNSSVDIAGYINAATYSVSITGGTLNGTSVTTSDTATLTFSAGGETAIMTVHKILSEKILIENLDLLKNGMWAKGNYIATNSANIILTAITALGSARNIEWHSSNSAIVNIVNGRLYTGATSGEVELTARATNCIDATITVNVLTPVTYFRLDQNINNDKLGLAQSKVIGSQSMVDGEIVNSVRLGIASVYPANAAQMFEFKSSNLSRATVDNNGNIVFSSYAIGQPVTITATPIFSTISAIASYTFNVVDGVNIGMGMANIYDETQNIMPSYAPYYDMHKVIDDTDYAVVLHTDVYMPSIGAGGEAFSNFTNSIFGNGHKLDGQFYSDSPKSRLLYWYLGTGANALSDNATIIIENLNVQAYKPTSDDSKEAFTSLIEKGGGPVCVEGARSEGQKFNIDFKFCLFQYAYSHLDFTAGDILVEGCIFRNNSATAITVQFCENDAANVTVKNCIFSNAIAPIGVILGDVNKVVKMQKNYVLKSSKFTYEGDNYIYNWKKVDEIRMDMLPSVPDNATFNALVYQINNMLSDFLRTVFTLKVNSDIMYYYEGSNYVNMGFLVLGLWYNANPQINPASYSEEGVNIHIDEDKYWLKQMDISGMPVMQNPLIRSLGILPENYAYVLNQRDKDGSYNTKPNETYNIDYKTYNRLHGENSN